MTIRGYAEGIQEGVIDQEYGLKTIVEETARLNEFAKKVLMLSKLSGQALNRETVDLGQLLEGTFQRYQPMAAQKGLELDLQKQAKPLSFCLDEERYRQAIGNLIANALRYASSRIILGSLMEADRVGIYVEDDGSGVPPHKIDAIFTRFEKGEKGQTGLGLAIVKRIMVQHEGDVVAENRKEGFRVTMWFPTE
jgi:signal transduction histidine kinase